MYLPHSTQLTWWKSPKYFGDKQTFYYKPLHVEKYKSLMGSLDKTDQLLEPYANDKKSLAWFKKLGIHFIFRAFLNSFLAHKNTSTYKKDFLNFIIAVMGDLAAYHSEKAKRLLEEDKVKRARPQVPQKKRKSELQHNYLPFKPAKKNCNVCNKTFRVRKQTVHTCNGCRGEIGLCSYSDFMAYYGRGKPEAPKFWSRRWLAKPGTSKEPQAELTQHSTYLPPGHPSTGADISLVSTIIIIIVYNEMAG